MASNLPPGVNVSDIPGNRPEDEAWEKLLEEFYIQLAAEGEVEVDLKSAGNILEKAIQFGLDKGRQECEVSSRESDFYCSEYLKKEVLRAIDETFSQEPKETF